MIFFSAIFLSECTIDQIFSVVFAKIPKISYILGINHECKFIQKAHT